MTDNPAISLPAAPDTQREPSWLDDLNSKIKPREMSNLLLWLVVFFFVAALIWAAFTELDRTIRGHGRIVPGPQMQVVSNLEGGVVSEIMAKVGDDVSEGDPLIALDQTQTGAALGASRTEYEALDLKARRLQAEIRGETPRFPPASDASMAGQIEIERALYASRMAELSGLVSAAQARISQSTRAVAEARSSYASRVAARDGAQAEVDALRPLVERGIEPRLSLQQAESRLSSASYDAQAAAAAVSRAEASVAEARSSLAQARQQWRARAANELATVQAQAAALQRNLPALADRVERTIVRSPLSGSVNRVLVSTVGGTVAPGQPLVEVVPSGDELIVEASISPKDIAQVRIGQDARIELTAYNSAVYGYLEGEVLTISPDTTVDERTGASFYTVQLATTDIPDDERNLEIGPGMVVNVMLLGEKQSVLDYILTPITRLRQRAFRE
ncbi:HlyD family type I secretion periplasmic adaptor subunit [Sphingomicrobium clamense]|uniref:Membrane fusion protein (MFP) family protein n=1 Tax=Sphingomicrobium clamense TaxID=2851013 RepID=A0ABS6V3L5_9SPHN|nr:HlyD family type I secretion periplasmic adaptor subunit [Sphingomicrobium sp. B8]MBW0144145.1 HlyD family type I secretion periplasmic adaptor subunit [Sphingomicrobium sp. B8]